MGNSEKEKAAPEVRKLDFLFPKESFEIKAACIAVHKALGCGFLENIYENALAHELTKRGFQVRQQSPLTVFYDGLLMGEYAVDILVNEKFIIEIKASEKDNPAYRTQLINYLKASGLPLGFLVNFGKQFFDFDRIVFTKGQALDGDLEDSRS